MAGELLLLQEMAAQERNEGEKQDEEEEVQDELGLSIFPSARVLLQWLSEGSSIGAPNLEGKTLLELGAGTGFLAMGLTAPDGKVAAKLVYATEGGASCLENMRQSVQAQGCEDRVVPLLWNWEKSLHAPEEVPLEEVDLIIGSDLVYLGTAEDELSAALAALLRNDRMRPDLYALLLMCDRPPGGEEFLPNPLPASGTRAVERFLRACRGQGLAVAEIELPTSWEVPEVGNLGDRTSPSCPERLRLFELRSTPDIALTETGAQAAVGGGEIDAQAAEQEEAPGAVDTPAAEQLPVDPPAAALAAPAEEAAPAEAVPAAEDEAAAGQVASPTGAHGPGTNEDEGSRKWKVDTGYIDYRTADPDRLEGRRASGEAAAASAGVVASTISATTKKESDGKWKVDTSYINARTADVDNLEQKQQAKAAASSDTSAPSSTVKKDAEGKWKVDMGYINYRSGDTANLTKNIGETQENQYADPSEKKYSYEMLKGVGARPEGVDPKCKELYLSEADFELIFGMALAAFQKMPKWKQANLKKAKDVF